MFFRERVRRTYVRVLNEEECLKETYYTRLRRKIGAAAHPNTHAVSWVG